MKNYGGTKEEWRHFDEFLELTDDLLPVVCHPHAKISGGSSLKGLGKTPSIYNSVRQVAGFPKWTQFKATYKDVEKWKANPDYGLCIQTRFIRAFDIDISDMLLSDQVADIVEKHFGYCPRRTRPGTGKQLLAFIVREDVRKKIIRLPEGQGIVELLGTGNQFVAIGAHFNKDGPTGTRYTWPDGLPKSFPEVTLDQLTAALAEIKDTFGVTLQELADGQRKAGPDNRDLILQDEILGSLDILGYGTDSQAFIECPWKSGHSSDSGISETCYFPAGTRGYEQGHFKCQHASCANKTRAEFIEALFPDGDLYANDFDHLPAIVIDKKRLPDLDLSKLERTGDGAKFLPTLTNLLMITRNPIAAGIEVRYDTFRDEMVVWDDDVGAWAQFKETTLTQMRERYMKQGCAPINKYELKDAVELVAFENSFDSMTEWCKSIPWDGVPRIDTLLADYFGVEQSPYHRAVGRYMMTALAGRALVPGIKADMAPVFQGRQGQRKSSAIEALAPHEELFVTLTEDDSDADIARKMRGCAIIEMEEMAVTNRRDITSIKAFVSRRKETWVPKFKEYSHNFYRRCLLIGTTNPDYFLADDTGHRRFLPVKVEGVCDPEGIASVRDQLWAEGRELFLKEGIQWQEAEQLADVEHGNFVIQDDWHNAIERWLDAVSELEDGTDGLSPLARGWTTTEDILEGALNIRIERHEQKLSNRVNKVMKGLGWQKITKRFGKTVRRVWRRSDEKWIDEV